MPNFKEAFETGQNAVRKIEEQRQEVKDVFSELNKQIGDLIGGKLKIVLNAFMDTRTLVPVERFCIDAFNPESEERITLAGWEQ